MKAISTTLATACLLASIGCSKQAETTSTPPSTPSNTPEAALTQSIAIAADLQKALGSQLKSKMQSEGPIAAIRLCNTVASPTTQTISEKYPDATVSRTALRVRNPENTADATSTAVLENWEVQLANGESPTIVLITTEDERIITHQPIMTSEVCLKCHGDPASFPPELASTLAELYPNDQATHLKAGDLRGAIRIEFQESPR